MVNIETPSFVLKTNELDDTNEGIYHIRVNFELINGNVTSSVLSLSIQVFAKNGRDAYEKATNFLKEDIQKNESKIISIEKIEIAEVYFLIPKKN